MYTNSFLSLILMKFSVAKWGLTFDKNNKKLSFTHYPYQPKKARNQREAYFFLNAISKPFLYVARTNITLSALSRCSCLD